MSATRIFFLLMLAASGSVFADAASDISSDPCVYDCCAKYGGMPAVLQSGGAPTCLSQPDKCVIIYNGETKGSYDVACVIMTGTQKTFSGQGVLMCLRDNCRAGWVTSTPSPFNIGPEEPEPEPEEPESVCDGVSCPGVCRDEGGQPAFYYDGRCVEDNSTQDGYYCGYTRGICIWKCNGAGTNCDDADPLSLTISEPASGKTYDPGTAGSNTVNVSGTVRSGGGHSVARVAVSTTLLSATDAAYDPASGRFSLQGVAVPAGKPTYITATAYDASGRRLASRTVTVYSAPKLLQLGFKKGYVTLLRNGQVIGSDWTEGFNSYEAREGDEFQVTGGGTVTATYSDGTMVILKAPFTVRFFKDAIHIKQGAAEVDVKRNYEVLGRLGHHVVKGTRFKVIVPESSSTPESLIVLQGTVRSGLAEAPESAVDVAAGQRLYVSEGIMPAQGSAGAASAAEMLSFAQGGEVTAPDTGGSSSGCGSAAVLAAALLGCAAIRR